MAGSRFDYTERKVIESCRRRGMSFRAIGEVLGRDHSAVFREVARNRNRFGGYRAKGAQRKAERRARRPKVAKLDDRRLYRRVKHLLTKTKYSPAATAAVLRAEGYRICHETIYRAIYLGRFGDPTKVLCRPRRYRKRRTRTGQYHDPLGDFTSIDDRPTLVGAGHWEADLLVGRRNLTAVVVLVELVTRYTVVVALENRTAAHTATQLIAAVFSRIPKHLRKTLTLDQGREFARWAEIAARTGFEVFFCHPHAPWEKPLVENTNALLRRWLPRGTVFPTNQKTLDRIAGLLNRMPRRSHRWDTAANQYRQARVVTTM